MTDQVKKNKDIKEDEERLKGQEDEVRLKGQEEKENIKLLAFHL